MNQLDLSVTRSDTYRRVNDGRMSRRQAARLLAGLSLAGAGGALLNRARLGASAGAPAPLNNHSSHSGMAQADAGTPAASGPALGDQPDGSYVWKVQVGGMDMEHELDLQAFFPGTLTVNAGDSVYFELPDMPGFHTVTFLSGEAPPEMLVPDPAASPTAGPPQLLINPAVIFPSGGSTYDGTGFLNSGADIFRQPGDPPVVITFTEPGTYEYLCVPHGAVMKGTIVVQPSDAARLEDQAAVDARAEAERMTLIDEGLATIDQYATARSTEREDGTTLWEVAAGAGHGQARVMRFLPQTLEISAGDTVRWSNLSDGEPHTVTFLGPGTEPPENSIVEPQADGPPKLIQNPETLLAQGGDVYQGEGFFHSGFMGVIAPGGPTYGGSNPYELTFDTPGEYGYYCLLHGSGPAGPGMFGTIIVH